MREEEDEVEVNAVDEAVPLTRFLRSLRSHLPMRKRSVYDTAKLLVVRNDVTHARVLFTRLNAPTVMSPGSTRVRYLTAAFGE